MADEYILKETVLNYLKHHSAFKSKSEIIQDIAECEPADVAPVVHAYWIPQKENYEFKEAWMKCSACGYPVSKWTGNTNFCPNCGAKMDGKE